MVTFIFVLYMVAMWEVFVLGVQSSHTLISGLFVLDNLEGFKGILDLGLCTLLGRDLLKYLNSLVGFAKINPSCPRMVGRKEMI